MPADRAAGRVGPGLPGGRGGPLVRRCPPERASDGEPEWVGGGEPEWVGGGEPEWVGGGEPEWVGDGEPKRASDGEEVAAMSPAQDVAALTRAASDAADRALADVDLDRAVAAIERLGRVALASMLDALRRRGLFTAPGDRHTVQEVLTRAHVVPEHRGLIRRWLTVLTREGLLAEDGGWLCATPGAAEATGPALDRAWAWIGTEWRAAMGAALTIEYARRNAERLPDLMTGAVPAFMLLFPEGGMRLARALYRESVTARYQHGAVAALVAEIARRRRPEQGPERRPEQGPERRPERGPEGRPERGPEGRPERGPERGPEGRPERGPEGRPERGPERGPEGRPVQGSERGPVRILEVGAGTGATTEAVLPALDGVAADYLYTDVSRYFLDRARERLRDRAWVRFARLDIDADPGPQGYAPGSFDVVVGGGVLNAARDTDASVRWLAGLLAPGGWLVLSEPTVEEYWVMTSLAFMMADPGDGRAETGATFLTLDQWHAVLDRAGLRRAVTLPGAGHPLERLGHRVFAATTGDGPGAVSPDLAQL
ncbi:methyltransferase [Thermopolyspora sp. NPDC052614]|uniref:methyltransferase n=1 Tax=Thermopolyspora sp. NPDC052614 TaxID=3155682 RepID=UPI003431329F